jgi:hypothetical protein
MAILFDQGNGLSKEVWVKQEWKPKLLSRRYQKKFNKKIAATTFTTFT